MDFFEGLGHVPVNYAQAEAMHNQVLLISNYAYFQRKMGKKMKKKKNKICTL